MQGREACTSGFRHWGTEESEAEGGTRLLTCLKSSLHSSMSDLHWSSFMSSHGPDSARVMPAQHIYVYIHILILLCTSQATDDASCQVVQNGKLRSSSRLLPHPASRVVASMQVRASPLCGAREMLYSHTNPCQHRCKQAGSSSAISCRPGTCPLKTSHTHTHVSSAS